MKIKTVELEDEDCIAGGYGSGIPLHIKNDKDELYRSEIHRHQIDIKNPIVEVEFIGSASDPYYSILKWKSWFEYKRILREHEKQAKKETAIPVPLF